MRLAFEGLRSRSRDLDQPAWRLMVQHISTNRQPGKVCNNEELKLPSLLLKIATAASVDESILVDLESD